MDRSYICGSLAIAIEYMRQNIEDGIIFTVELKPVCEEDDLFDESN